MANPRSSRRRFEQKVNQVQAQPTQITPSAQFLSSATPRVPGNVLGRMGRGMVQGNHQVNAPATAPAAGNAVVTSDSRGAPAGSRKNGGTNNPGLYDLTPANRAPWPYASVFTPASLDSAGAHARTDAFQHGHLIAHDRHIIQNQGRTTSSNRQQATGGSPNPEASGPPRPTWKMFNRTLSKMYGADHTAQLDNNQYHASVIVPGRNRKFPLGTQGTEWAVKNGGTPGLANHRPYGHRGGFDAGAPLPTVRADAGGPVKYGTLLQVGAPGDGPQKIYGGLPWGLHSPTLPQRQGMQSLIRSRIGQVKPVWNVRPLNSKSAGQSWSQSMVSLSGQQAVKLGSTQPIRQPGMNARWLGV
jgi:hypothetical protein